MTTNPSKTFLPQLGAIICLICTFFVFHIPKAHGRTVAFLVNASKDTNINKELKKWKDSPQLKNYFDEVVTLYDGSPDGQPLRPKILARYQELKDVTQLFLILIGNRSYAGKIKTGASISTSELSVEEIVYPDKPNERVFIDNILLIEYGQVFEKFNGQGFKDNSGQAFEKIKLYSKVDLSRATVNNIAAAAVHLKDIRDILENSRERVQASRFETTIGSNFLKAPEVEEFVLVPNQKFSRDQPKYFVTQKRAQKPTSANRLIFDTEGNLQVSDSVGLSLGAYGKVYDKDIFSPYFYGSEPIPGGGYRFVVFNKNNEDKVFTQAVHGMIHEEEAYSVEQKEYQYGIFFSFLGDNQEWAGIFADWAHAGTQEYKELLLNDFALTVQLGYKSKEDRGNCLSLLYLTSDSTRGSLKSIPVFGECIGQGKAETIVSSPELRDLHNKDPKLIWNTTSAVILSQDGVFSWRTDVGPEEGQMVYAAPRHTGQWHADFFMSGNEKHFGFFWSAITTDQEERKSLLAFLFLEKGKTGTFRKINISEELIRVISKPQADYLLVKTYFSDKYGKNGALTELKGVVLYNKAEGYGTSTGGPIAIYKTFDLPTIGKPAITVSETVDFSKGDEHGFSKFNEGQIHVFNPEGKKLIIAKYPDTKGTGLLNALKIYRLGKE